TRWPAPGCRDPLLALDGEALDRAAEVEDRPVRRVDHRGGGIVHAGAAGTAVAFAEKVSSPTVMTLMALGAMPPEHTLSLGMLGMHGARYTNRALDECDLLIAAGARFDDRATGKVA